MRREFLINIFILILINLLIKPFYTFIIETEVQNRVGPSTYGLYFALFNFTYLFQIIQDIGIQNYGSQFVAKNTSAAVSYLEDTIGLRLLLSGVYLLVLVVVGFAFGYGIDIYWLLLLVGLNHILSGFFAFFRSILAAIGKYRWNSFFSVFEKILMIISLSFLLFISELGQSFEISTFVIVRTVSFGLALVAVLVVMSRVDLKLNIVFKWGKAIRILRKTYPFAVVILLMTLYNRLDGIMLERLLLDDGLEAGRYAAGYRLYHAMTALGVLFSMLLLPMFSNLLVNDLEELKELLSMSLEWLVAASVMAVFSVWMIGGDLMSVLYRTDADLYGTTILSTLCISFVFVCFIYIFGTLLTANGRLREMNILFVVGIFINFGCNLWLIPTHGAEGAATATLVTQLVVAIGLVVLTKSVIGVTIKMFSVYKLISFVLITGLIFFVSNTYLGRIGHIPSYIIALLLTCVTAFGLRILDIKNLKTLILNKSISV